MDLLQQAVARNNEGVELLRAGKSVAGAANLQSAAHTLKVLSTAVVGYPDDSHRTTDTPKVGFCFDNSNPGLVGLQNDLHFIYSRPLLLSSAFEAPGKKDHEWMVRVASTTIIFNLALSWHVQGKVTGQSAYLRKAGQLYGLVVNVLCTADDENDVSSLVLECVTLNNMAELYYELGDYETNLTYMEDICDLLVSNDCLDLCLDPREADEIRVNLCHAHPPSIAAAA